MQFVSQRFAEPLKSIEFCGESTQTSPQNAGEPGLTSRFMDAGHGWAHRQFSCEAMLAVLKAGFGDNARQC